MSSTLTEADLDLAHQANDWFDHHRALLESHNPDAPLETILTWTNEELARPWKMTPWFHPCPGYYSCMTCYAD